MSISFAELSHEAAFELVAEMTTKEKKVTDATEVWQGTHPVQGDIYVVIPALGNPLLLPLVIQGMNV